MIVDLEALQRRLCVPTVCIEQLALEDAGELGHVPFLQLTRHGDVFLGERVERRRGELGIRVGEREAQEVATRREHRVEAKAQFL